MRGSAREAPGQAVLQPAALRRLECGALERGEARPRWDGVAIRSWVAGLGSRQQH